MPEGRGSRARCFLRRRTRTPRLPPGGSASPGAGLSYGWERTKGMEFRVLGSSGSWFCSRESEGHPSDQDRRLRSLHGVAGPAEEDSAQAGRRIPGPGPGCGLGAGERARTPRAGLRAASLGRALLAAGLGSAAQCWATAGESAGESAWRARWWAALGHAREQAFGLK
jgi:hypothetical protein